MITGFCPQCNRYYEGKNFCPLHGQKLFAEHGDQIIGRIIDNKYLIQQEIGEGGTGIVYRASHIKLDMTVAVKILHHKFSNDPVAVERFRREAYAAMQIRHPNAIAVLDFGITSDQLVYVVMELLEGITLRDRLEEHPVFSLEEAYAIIKPVCEALNVAHRIGIIHRDLKPENIFLDRHGKSEEVVKVLDFGIAQLQSINEEHAKRSMRLTQEGILIGTPHYMSPEQCYGREVDARSDVYCLGIILYEMLTGQLPFDDRSLSIVAVKQAREKPKPIYEIQPDIPHIVNAVVMHALEKRPENRPSSVMAFAQELEAAMKVLQEKEFRSVFLNASDEDLEAALLLTSTPGERFEQRRAGRKTDASHSPNRVTEKTRALEAPKGTRPLESNFDPTETIQEPQITATFISLSESEVTVQRGTDETGFETYSSGNFEDIEDYQGLYEQLLQLTKETPILMQIVAADLEAKKPIDLLFLHEMKQAIDNLKSVICKLERIIEATTTKEERL
ncbi:MAG: serine/threonine-protein kinase [Acidobacteriota bacterium]|nr:serine/threonine protein kinase [Blastocatellia bacterium]MDW8413692.1 serine/threonine-protein kinase [Acidobacteriota bacterium]